MNYKKLLIISHTEHYVNAEQEIVGWGSTVNEVNFLADFWEEVTHIGCLYDTNAPKSALPYTKNNIRFVSIPPFGGKSVASKLEIILKIPKIISTVFKHQKNATEVQLRLPTSMGLYLLPLFSIFLSKKYTFWVKYAGDWSQVNPPLSYKIQRWWLKNNLANCKVTINGFWDNQPENCLSFENPCLTDGDIHKGKEIIKTKKFTGSFTLSFVGRLDEAKGVDVILEALKNIVLEKISKIHFIGDGEKRTHFEKEASFLKDKVIFHGVLGSEQVHQLLHESHFLLLPSKSEGFPKVIAEAACYGTIPIVSNVGSIAHYINTSNGFVWDKSGPVSFLTVLLEALETPAPQLQEQSKNLLSVAELFTFENYKSKLDALIFTDEK